MFARARNLIAHPKKYDGCYSIVTSKLNMGDRKMRETYKGTSPHASLPSY